MGCTAATGTLLQRQNPTTSVYQTVSGLGDMEGPEETVDTADVTSHSSPGSREELIATIKRTGMVSAPLNWDSGDPTHRALKVDYDGKLIRNWKIIMTDADGTEITFAGFIQRFSRSFPVGGANRVNFGLKITGDIVETY